MNAPQSLTFILPQYDVPAFRERLNRFFDVDLKTQAPLTAYPDREVYVLKRQSPDMPGAETIYLKRYVLINAKQIAQALFRTHKSQKAWRIANILLQKGILTPQPVAFFRRRARGVPDEFVLLTEGIPSGLSLRQYVRQWLDAQPKGERVKLKRRLIRGVAEFLASLHLAGVYHGDLTANNIFIELREDDVRVYLIDLDSVRSTRWISRHRRIKNLDELGRNFLELRLFSTSDRVRFLTCYLARYGKDTETVRGLFYEVWQRTQYRLRKHRQRFVQEIPAPAERTPKS